MGYLLVVLAVVLVPVVAQNQSHVPPTSSSCPAAVNQLGEQSAYQWSTGAKQTSV